MLCRDTSRGRQSRRLACLLSLFTFARIACELAFCNFESNQAISITLFGPRFNKKPRVMYYMRVSLGVESSRG